MQHGTYSILGVASLVLAGSAALAADAPRRSGDPGRGNAKVVLTEVGTVSTNIGEQPVPDSLNSQSKTRMLRARQATPAAPRACDERSALNGLGRWLGIEFDLACADQR